MAGGWESLGLLPELVKAAEEDFDWRLPTGIQDECIPLILGGNDVMGSAETGSGKTAAFALPIIQLCVEYKERRRKNDPEQKKLGFGDSSSLAAEKLKSGKPVNDSNNIKFVMSLQDRDPTVAIHPNSDGLRIQSKDKNRWAGVRCSAGVSSNSKSDRSSGMYSFECTVLDDEGTVRVGWSAADASLTLGTDSDGYGYGGSGVKVHKNKYDPYPNERLAFGKDDVIGCHLKIDSTSGGGRSIATISFSKNGKFLGEAFNVPQPRNNSAEVCFFPTVCFKNTECVLNFGSGNKPFQHTLPQGYLPLAKVVSHKNDLAVNPRDALSGSVSPSGKSGGNKIDVGPMAIVIEPTRDLAEQTYRCFDDLNTRLEENAAADSDIDENSKEDYSVKAALLVGGIKPQATLRALEQNKVDVLVGTPPIITSYMKKGTIRSGRCRFFVLDEADELISTDSIIHIRAIYGRILALNDGSNLPASNFERLQVLFFSATLHSKEVQDLAQILCHKPNWVDLRGKNDSILPDTVHHIIINVTPNSFDKCIKKKIADFIQTDSVHRKGDLDDVVNMNKLNRYNDTDKKSEQVKQLKPHIVLDVIDKFNMDQVLIFCRTNLDCDLMEIFLQNAGSSSASKLTNKYTCRVLAGMRSMQEREQSLQEFKDGEVRILICTDVAARGIDIRELPFVINCTLPDKSETYVHRIGRVGRAERMGLAISLVSTIKERVWFCQKGKKPPCKDTRDYDKGGNCVWYDEPKYCKDIEKLMQQNKKDVTKLTWPDRMKLPDDIQTIVTSGGYGSYAGGGTIEPEVQSKMKEIESQVKQLSQTEMSLQSDYWSLRNFIVS